MSNEQVQSGSVNPEAEGPQSVNSASPGTRKNSAPESAQSESAALEAGKERPEAMNDARNSADAGTDREAPVSQQKYDSDDLPAEKGRQAQPHRPGFLGRFFNASVKFGPLIPLIALACMVWPDFWRTGAALYCPTEINVIQAFLHSAANASWVAPMTVDGSTFSMPQWPGLYWFMGLLAAIPGVVDSGWLFALTGSLTAALALIGAWSLCLSARFGAAAALASCLILLCAPLFTPLSHFIGPAALAAGLLMLSMACFCRGWHANRAILSLPAAFILAGLAGMTAGPCYLLVPLLASFFYLLWRGELSRAQSFDALIGFVLLLAMIGCWLGVMMIGNHPATFLSDLMSHTAHPQLPPAPGWWLGLLVAGLGLLPWLFEILGVSWFRVLGRAPKTLAASRKDNASAFIWIVLIIFCCGSAFSLQKNIVAVTLVCLAAILLAKAFVNLSGLGRRFFFLLASLAAICAGALTLMASFPSTQGLLLEISPIKPSQEICVMLAGLTALPIIGAILAIGGILVLYFAKRDDQGGGLIYSTLLAIILTYPFLFMLVPQLGEQPSSGLMTLSAISAQAEAIMNALPTDATPQELAPAEQAPVIKERARQEQTAPEASVVEPASDASAAVDGTTGAPEPSPIPQEPAAPAPVEDIIVLPVPVEEAPQTGAGAPEMETGREIPQSQQPASDPQGGAPESAIDGPASEPSTIREIPETSAPQAVPAPVAPGGEPGSSVPEQSGAPNSEPELPEGNVEQPPAPQPAPPADEDILKENPSTLEVPESGATIG